MIFGFYYWKYLLMDRFVLILMDYIYEIIFYYVRVKISFNFRRYEKKYVIIFKYFKKFKIYKICCDIDKK